MHMITTLHSWIRWIVLAAGFLVLMKGAFSFLARERYSPRDRLLLSIFLRTLEIQASLGIILAVQLIFFKNPTVTALAHALLGLIAVGLVHLGFNKLESWKPAHKVRNIFLTALAGMAVAIAGLILILRHPAQIVIEPDQTLTGHSQAVRSVAFSPDGKTLASGSFDGLIKLWNVESGRVVTTLNGSEAEVRGVVFSPDGSQLASVSFDRKLRIWRLPDGELLHDVDAHDQAINAVLYSVDGSQIVTASLDNKIKFWDAQSGQLEGESEIEGGLKKGLLTIAYSNNDELLASGSVDHTIHLWNAERQELPFVGSHTNWVYDLAFSPVKPWIASVSIDSTIRVWNVETGKMVGEMTGHEGPVQTIAFSPDGKYLVTGGADGKIIIWDPDHLREITFLNAHTKGVLDLAFSPDGKYLASSSADQTIRLWKVNP